MLLSAAAESLSNTQSPGGDSAGKRDWTSQTIVALPLLLLYEISVIIVSRVDKGKAKAEAEWS